MEGEECRKRDGRGSNDKQLNEGKANEGRGKNVEDGR